MSTTNGNGKLPTVSELREQVQRERLHARLAQAGHERQLWESFGLGYGAAAGWGDLLNPYGYRRDDWGRTWLPLNQGGMSAKKDGRNDPFVSSDSDLDNMRALAYWLTTKNDLAIGATRTIRNLTIKQGYEWEAKPANGHEDDEKAVKLAAQVQHVIDRDADLNKLPQRERSSCWRAVRDGEALVRHFPQSDGTTRHRFVRAEQLRDPGHGPHCSFGIETVEGDVEDVLAYWITYDGTSYDRVCADDLSHLKRNVDEEIKRGVSDFYSAGEVFDQTAKLLRSMGKGATLLSKIAWIEEFAGVTGDQLRAHAGGRRDLNVPRYEDPRTGKEVNTQYMPDGKVLLTQDNHKFVPPPLASNVPNFVAVVQACLRAVGVRWGFPEYFISGDASNNNYASILVSGSPLVNGIECEQDDFGVFFLRWRWVAVRNACAAGLIDATFDVVERLVDVTFTPPQVAVANESERADVDSRDIAAGVMSLQTRAARRGLDWEQEQKFIAESPPTRIPGRVTDVDARGNPVADAKGGPAPAGQKQAVPAPADGQGASSDQAGLRATVGGLQAVQALQTAVYGGQLPREAAIANAMIMFGFSHEEASRLFPEVEPEKTADEGDQGGAGVYDSIGRKMGDRAAKPAPVTESLSGPLREQYSLVLELL